MAKRGSTQDWHHRQHQGKHFLDKLCIRRSLARYIPQTIWHMCWNVVQWQFRVPQQQEFRHQTSSSTCLSTGRRVQDLHCRLIRSGEVHREGLVDHRMAREARRGALQMDQGDPVDHQKGLEALVGHQTPARSSSRRYSSSRGHKNMKISPG